MQECDTDLFIKVMLYEKQMHVCFITKCFAWALGGLSLYRVSHKRKRKDSASFLRNILRDTNQKMKYFLSKKSG